MWPFTDARQARIDALAFENSRLEEANTKLWTDLAEVRRQNGMKGRMADEFLRERDAARIERDTAQRERDGYRERLLRFTAPRERGPGGRFVKPKPATNGAAGQAAAS